MDTCPYSEYETAGLLSTHMFYLSSKGVSASIYVNLSFVLLGKQNSLFFGYFWYSNFHYSDPYCVLHPLCTTRQYTTIPTVIAVKSLIVWVYKTQMGVKRNHCAFWYDYLSNMYKVLALLNFISMYSGDPNSLLVVRYSYHGDLFTNQIHPVPG